MTKNKKSVNTKKIEDEDSPLNEALIGTGATMIVTGIVPTPDDVTVISPIAQIVGGAGLVSIGLLIGD